MKKAILLITLITLGAALGAYPILIRSWDINSDVSTLNKLRISVDNVNRQEGTIIADVRNDSEFDLILDNGFNAVKLPDIARENALRLHAERPTESTRDEYLTNPQYNQFMIDTAAQYSNICQLVQFGTTIQGRPLYFLKITDNPLIEENEPEFKYSSSIHGNEVVGYDMCIRLIQQLTSEYGTSTRITNLVDNTEIWICPLNNPDGFVLGQRYNADGIDLNRNFPMVTGEQHPDGEDWAPENIAMMNFCNAHTFILSANFHGGSLVMNYPWDYTYTLAPDDALLQAAALTYSSHNSPMYNSTEFSQGITNGAAWYVITGSMQDWNYGMTSCTDITAEITYDYWPPASVLDSYWANNQESMLSYMEFVHKGVNGTVTAAGGLPLNAVITVQGNSKLVRTDPDVGDYHRMLLPGTYQITASCAGYIPQTASVTVSAMGTAVQNFELQPAMQTVFKVQLRNAQGVPVANATVRINSEPVITCQSDAQGCFETPIFEGSYEATITAPGYGTVVRNLSVAQSDFRNIIFVLPPLFEDGFENGIANWVVTGSWAIVTNDGSQVATDSPAGNYGNNQNRPLRIANPLSLLNITNPYLSFRIKYALESGYDFLYVEVSTNGTSWTQLGSFTGTQTAWTSHSYSLANYVGGGLYVRFRLYTDNSQTADGVYLDDVSITGINSSTALYGDVTGEAVVNMTDITAVNDYANGLDPLPALDPRPWTANRENNADTDNNGSIDAFDSYLLMKYVSEPAYIVPVISGTPEPVQDPIITAEYDNGLVFGFAHPEYIKSLQFTTSPVNMLQVLHNGYVFGNPYHQSFNGELDSYCFAGYNIQTETISATLEDNPASFTLQYTVNGVPGSLFIDTSSAGDDPQTPQAVFALQQNQPNPFRTSTAFRFSLDKDAASASLRIYNTRGQLIRTVLNSALASGFHQITWDGLDDNSRRVPSGIYFYRLQSGERSLTRKLLIVN